MQPGTRLSTTLALTVALAAAVATGTASGALSLPAVSRTASGSAAPGPVPSAPAETPAGADAEDTAAPAGSPAATATPSTTTPSGTAATDQASPEPEPDPEPEPGADPESAPGPAAGSITATAAEPLLQRGDRGRRVRELQHRLLQLSWLFTPPTGGFDRATVRAVRGFQAKRGFEATGSVDPRTWRRLVQMSREPTDAELFNRSGPALLSPGDSGSQVRDLQARLRQIGWFYGDVSDSYGEQTTTAVRGFQGKRRIPVTGAVDRRTLDLLAGMTHQPTADELANRPPDPADGAPLDPRCTTGKVLCVDKSSQSLRWVVDGEVLSTVDARFGAAQTPTREGQFTVQYKSRDHVSSLFDTSMPFAMFFSGGQAVHYSADFAARGYDGASHGCVNIRDYDAVAWLFDQVSVGDRVVVYWS